MQGPANPAFSTPRQIVNKWALAGFNASVIAPGRGKYSASPAMGVANTLTTVLSLAGSGIVNYLSLVQADAVVRNLRVKLVLDGVTVFDFTSAPTPGNTNYGLTLVGTMQNIGTYDADLVSMPFKTSCVLSISSSVVELANAFVVDTIYWLT
jgi:hypothetical protein